MMSKRLLAAIVATAQPTNNVEQRRAPHAASAAPGGLTQDAREQAKGEYKARKRVVGVNKELK